METVTLVSRCYEKTVIAGSGSYPTTEFVKTTDILPYRGWFDIDPSNFTNARISGFLSEKVRALNNEIQIDVSLLNQLGRNTVVWLTIPFYNNTYTGELSINGQTFTFSKANSLACYVHFKFSNIGSDYTTLTLREIHSMDINHTTYWRDLQPAQVSFTDRLRIGGSDVIIDKPIIQATDYWYIIDHAWEDGLPVASNLIYYDDGNNIYRTYRVDKLGRYGIDSYIINNTGDLYITAQPSMNFLSPRYIFPQSSHPIEEHQIYDPSVDYAVNQSKDMSMFGGSYGNTYNIADEDDFILVESFYNKIDRTSGIRLFKNGLIPFISDWDEDNKLSLSASGSNIYPTYTINWNTKDYKFKSALSLTTPGTYRLYLNTSNNRWHLVYPDKRDKEVPELSNLNRKSVLILMIGGGGSGRVGVSYIIDQYDGFGGGSGAMALCYGRLFRPNNDPLIYELVVGAGGSSVYGHNISGNNGGSSSIGVKETNNGPNVNSVIAQGGSKGTWDEYPGYRAEIDSSNAGGYLKVLSRYSGSLFNENSSKKTIKVPLIHFKIALPGGSHGSDDTGHDGAYHDYAYGGAGSPFGSGGSGHRRANGNDAPRTSYGAGGGSGTADQNGVFGIGDFDVSSGAGASGGIWIFY